ncbi:MAG: FKBP-type peptidyl-prolyl cis-trans isomerase [Bacteroidales bacterium]|mgnify:FL=1|nr:FKBP-type peptidyl-prolyl cis-trans isomerase [Bacteroidales bacterium]
MKSLKIVALAAVAFVAVACVTSPKVNPQPKGISKAAVDSASYALGANLGMIITMNDMGDMNLSEIIKGYKDALNGVEGLDGNFINETLNAFMNNRMMFVAEENLAKGQKFLEENGKKDGVVTLEDGLQYQIVRAGNGVKPTSAMDTVEVNYEGKLIDGKVFDSSYERGESISFPLNQVISGWSEGLMFAEEGGELNLWIPSDLAYGQRGPGGPNQTLIFKVELIKVRPYVEKAE